MDISRSRYRDYEARPGESPTALATHATPSATDPPRSEGVPADRTGGQGAGLAQTADLLRVLSDPTRARLLHLLALEDLSVAELVRVTRLPQPRVSTHLGKLREAGLVRDRRSGNASFYAFEPERAALPVRHAWSALGACAADPLLAEDRRRLREVLRGRGRTWAEGVAGQMERHYSPGRTYESALHGLLGLCRLGDVLDVASGDGALAAMIAPRARSVTCLDLSARVVAAGRRRLRHLPRVHFERADMHALPLAPESFDEVLLMHALSFAEDPDRVLREASRVLRPGGRLALVTLRRHPHRSVAEGYDHLQMGFDPADLGRRVKSAGLEVQFCDVVSREKRAPHFEALAVHASRPGGPR